jgi:hypothetical protein
MINELIKLADHLDKKGLHKEAEYIDAALEKSAQASAREFSSGDVALIIHGHGGLSWRGAGSEAMRDRAIASGINWGTLQSRIETLAHSTWKEDIEGAMSASRDTQ